MEIFDLIVIGGGPAGYLTAERAGHAGLKTMVIEKNEYGGVCLNEGCVPSKTFLNSAKVVDYANHAANYGVKVNGTATIDQKFVVERKNGVVKMLVSGIKAALKKNKVVMKSATAFIEGKDENGYIVKAGEEKFAAKRLMIATGSMPVVPPIPGVKEGVADGFVLTNKEVLDLTELPKNLVVIGGGVIGLELTSYFSSVGVNVSVVEMLDKIAGPTEKEISAILQKSLERKGVKFYLGAKVVAVEKDGVVFEKDGKKEKIPADKVLLSIGRRAVSAGIGLENIGVNIERGAVITDDRLQTNVASVYAAG
ncbi:MAG: FAD-dependent oxidoreductase, partial [Clostridia bacterium]|nr:FAD-dependent oxidoreductase [Clostridia bacterium]